jgi:hypothetical protein
VNPTFVIYAREANGRVFRAFTWTRDSASGIRRAWADAEKFGITLTTVWAVPMTEVKS